VLLSLFPLSLSLSLSFPYLCRTKQLGHLDRIVRISFEPPLYVALLFGPVKLSRCSAYVSLGFAFWKWIVGRKEPEDLVCDEVNWRLDFYPETVRSNVSYHWTVRPNQFNPMSPNVWTVKVESFQSSVSCHWTGRPNQFNPMSPNVWTVKVESFQSNVSYHWTVSPNQFNLMSPNICTVMLKQFSPVCLLTVGPSRWTSSVQCVSSLLDRHAEPVQSNVSPHCWTVTLNQFSPICLITTCLQHVLPHRS